MTNTPSTAPLNTTSGTTNTTTNLPSPNVWDVGAQTYSADPGNRAAILTASATANAASITIPLQSLLAQNNIMLDAQFAEVVIVNSGTSQTITRAQLQFTDTIGGVAVTETYDLPEVGGVFTGASNGLPSGSAAKCLVPLRGILKNAQVVVYFGTAPTAGTVYVQAHLYAHGFSGTLPPRKVASFVASTVSGNGGWTPSVLAALHREVTHRTWMVSNNGTGVSISQIQLYLFESSVNNYAAPSSGNGFSTYTVLGAAPSNNAWGYDTDTGAVGTREQLVSAPFDSFLCNIGFGTGTIVANSTVDFYVIEKIG